MLAFRLEHRQGRIGVSGPLLPGAWMRVVQESIRASGEERAGAS